MSQYYTLLTPMGLAKVANAQVTQTTVAITKIAVGDSNGNGYPPTGKETALKNEKWRGGVTSVTVDLDNSNWVVVEGILPANVGGFTLREIGLYDEDNDLIAIGNYPETYKPVINDGSTMDLILRIIIEVNNADNVTLKIDPSVIIASRDYVDKVIKEVEIKQGTDIDSIQTKVIEHSAKIATTSELGHIKPDGETILVDPETGVASSSTTDIYQESVIRDETANALGYFTFAKGYDYATSILNVESDNSITIKDVSGLYVGNTVYIKFKNEDVLFESTIKSMLGKILTLNDSWDNDVKTALFLLKGINENSKYQYAEGDNSVASGNSSHAEGTYTISLGDSSHAEGMETRATGYISHAEGWLTNASATSSHSEGSGTNASGNASHAEGRYTTASGANSHSEGYYSKATGVSSHAEGEHTEASGYYSHAQNVRTIANSYASTAIGIYNKTLNGQTSSLVQTGDAFVIGNGTSPVNLSNAFRVTFDGKVYGLSAYNSAGADYAEFFEWLDGNLDTEDRVGFVVTLEGGKIRKARAEDTYILGIVSANPSVIGDSYQDDWPNKYRLDDWGRIQYDWMDVEYEEMVIIADENGVEHDEMITKTRQDYLPILNPKWNPRKVYIPREKRKEWDAVGLVGKLYVRDDGTCQVNSFAKVGVEDGILANSDETTNIRVMERVAPNIVRVFIK